MRQSWRRGDLVSRGSELGFVAADSRDQDEYLLVRWQSGVERICCRSLGSIRGLKDEKGETVHDLASLEALEATAVACAGMGQFSWRRGDLVLRGGELGFVVADFDLRDRGEYLVVRLQHSGVERIHHSKVHWIRRLREADLSAARALADLETRDAIQAAIAERMSTVRSRRERREVDGLIRRALARNRPECEWDRKNAELLLTLALRPREVGWPFRLREYLHRPVHRLFHRRYR